MKKLGNLLLILGTILAGVAAANSQRASRWVTFAEEADLAGEFVFEDVLGGDGEDAPAIASAGDELTADVVSRLRAAGRDGVLVRVPALDRETLPASSAADRVLSSPVEVGSETLEVEAGRRLTESLVIQLASHATDVILTTEDGTRTTLELVVLARDQLEGAREPEYEIAEAVTVEVPVVLGEGKFLDAAAVAQLEAAGVAEVEVAITRDFSFGGWEHRWLFLLGILAMVGGVGLKRSGGVAAVVTSETGGRVGPDELRSMLQTFEDAVRELGARADTMECDDIHTALDPLFLQYGQPFVEHRGVIQGAYGGAAFAHVLSPFSAAERRLNRAWSAAVDGYPKEAREQLKAAGPYLAEARKAFPD